ncbi:Otoferlin [Nymphon striatum]|nr:Otoferlin [Nymphon striatum]
MARPCYKCKSSFWYSDNQHVMHTVKIDKIDPFCESQAKKKIKLIVGLYGLVVQQLTIEGFLSISDSLLNDKNMSTGVFDVIYTAPETYFDGDYPLGSHEDPNVNDEMEALIDFQKDISNYERYSKSDQFMGRTDSKLSVISDSKSPVRKKSTTFGKSLTSMMKLGKQRPPPDDEEQISLKDAEHLQYGSLQRVNRKDHQNYGQIGYMDDDQPYDDDMDDDESVLSSIQIHGTPMAQRNMALRSANTSSPELTAQNFQVCITVIEGKNLPGLNLQLVVCVQVGDQKKYAYAKGNSISPYFQEYFVFDYHEAPAMFFDKIITLTVLPEKSFKRLGKPLGSFKIDVGTVFQQCEPLFIRRKGKLEVPVKWYTCIQEHNLDARLVIVPHDQTWMSMDEKESHKGHRQFYHKWAVLTDHEDVSGGPKGYLKCDISVIGKGDTVKPPPKIDKDNGDIHSNLLLPEGVPAQRQKAMFIVKIYKAEGLPQMNLGFIENVKKTFTGSKGELTSSYVEVSFAGYTGKTSVRDKNYNPVWNEQIVFTEMFPPLCQRMKIQIKDNDSVNNPVIGTHFIDLSSISNEGDSGFLPMMGPCYVYFYGSTRDYSMFDDNIHLNRGLGEGVSYRGRMLMSLRTELTDSMEAAPGDVCIECINPPTEASYGRDEDYFVFGCIMEATMLNAKLSEKDTYIEMSIGNAGNTMDIPSSAVKKSRSESESEDFRSEDQESISSASELLGSHGSHGSHCINSTTPPLKPKSSDGLDEKVSPVRGMGALNSIDLLFYYNLPFGDNKPCVYIISEFQDHRRRLYNSNLVQKILDKLDEGLYEVQQLFKIDHPNADKRLRMVLEELSAGCSRFSESITRAGGLSSAGKTRLDKERFKMCMREIEQIGKTAKGMKPTVTKENMKDKLFVIKKFLDRLKYAMEDPQQSLPDVFLWLVSGGKRIAYYRIQARHLLFSMVEEECGRDCGKIQTLLFKLPGKKSSGPTGWVIQAKVQIYLWLGVKKYKQHFLKKLPKGFEESYEIKHAMESGSTPPNTITYNEKQTFQLRAHMYQARSLIGSDSSGLSDPFARVLFGDRSLTTQVIDETLSPTWDETLVFDDVTVYGNNEHLKKDPPSVVIEIFDQDKVGKSEFIGRTLAKPNVTLSDDKYDKPPLLEWFQLYRGGECAGELLAAFEILQVSDVSERDALPPLPSPKESTFNLDGRRVLSVPKGIRPTLSKYKIEVLFWGLRDVKRINLMPVDKPRVDIECSGTILESSQIVNYNKNPNFSPIVKDFYVDLPEQSLYCPPITIRVVDCRTFGRYTLVGTHIINSLTQFIYTPKTRRDKELACRTQSILGQNNKIGYYNDANVVDDLLPRESAITIDRARKAEKQEKNQGNNKRKRTSVTEVDDEEENMDWWSKYFASMEELIATTLHTNVEGANNNMLSVNNGEAIQPTENDVIVPIEEVKEKKKHTFRGTATAIYPCELENVPDFNGFKEWLHTFDLFRGKKTGNDREDEKRIVGRFKGSLKVYKVPLPSDIEDHTITGGDPTKGLFQGLPSNDPIHVLVRIYIIKATDLHPADMNGKADPYIVINLGNKRTNDKENYISKQLNPVFGKCFEFEATFPQDSILTIQIFDWDLIGSDDLIGETRIDLENRFYSRHRATCGITSRYELQGYNIWRDPMKPTQILQKLCKDGKVEGPFYGRNRVRIANRNFVVQEDEIGYTSNEEELALAVFKKWDDVPKIGCKLVPEHVETRPLYNPETPGIEQGKLEMWVDMFPMDMPPPGPPLDISPRKPKSYELRIIIWNTDDVVLEDDAFFTGEKMSDIYVKGWMNGPEDTQATDIHYRSLTGEGNFNWRFIFPFDYLVAEEKIVISRKATMFSWDETECKIPARLELQVWDADHFSADDFLGSITLDLNRFPRGAKSSNKCTLNMLKPDSNVPMVSLFKQKRVKGWWPFYIKKDNDEMELTGKVEAEIHLLTKDEAEKNPAGLGRSEPDPLDKPNRPDSSFIWFLNPLKSIKYIIWHNYKWTILKVLLIIALAALLVLFFYSMPGYTMKKMIGA